MLESVTDTFAWLIVDLLVHMGNLGAQSQALRAAPLTRPHVESAFNSLNSATNTQSISQRARVIRASIEIHSARYAAEARAAAPASATTAEKAEIAEAAEALFEVFFASNLARKLLSDQADFSPIEYWAMSGLFDLMMHPHNPAMTATALELPYRLITSPGANTRFDHAGPAIRNDYDQGSRVELWHSRLRKAGSTPLDLGPEGGDFFAMWSPDYNREDGKPDFSAPGSAEGNEGLSLSAEDRRNLVKRTTGHNEEQHNTTVGSYYQPVPAKVRDLMLTPLGATLDAEGQWPDQSSEFPEFGGLIGWLHQATFGRDQNVVVSKAGWLFPMGFPATKITVTERKFRPVSATDHSAALHKRTFLIVGKAVLDFPEQGQAYFGRGLPFLRIAAVTRVTPDLDDSDDVAGVQGSFWTNLQGTGPRQPFNFEFEGTDPSGRPIGMNATQIWVPGGFEAGSGNPVQTLSDVWQLRSQRSKLNGQMMRLMAGDHPELDLPMNDIAFSANAITGNIGTAIGQGKRPFHPIMANAMVRVPAINELTGADPNISRQISYAQNYLDDLLDEAATKVVLELSEAIDLDFASDLTSDAMGALGQANQQIRALAAELGPVPLPDAGDIQALIQGSANWEDMLPDFKILGRFALHKLLEVVGVDANDMPTFRTEEDEQEIKRIWELRAPITQVGEEGFVSLSPRGDSAIFLQAFVAVTVETLRVQAEAAGASIDETIPTGVKDPRAESHGHMTNFDISLFNIIDIRFESVGFDVVAGKKPDAHVQLTTVDPLVFKGSLKFLNQLKELIPSDGFGNGPRINPGPFGVEASFDLALPNIQLGVFALKNMDLGASTTIPFDQRSLDVRFNFNERHRPFEIAIAGLGGGGFFAMSLDAGGIREIEASLEFGAVASMSIGVASGSISIKGGIYFRFTDQEMVLEGYVELRGKMSVLGLITASLLFHMSLAYIERNDRKLVRGEATLRIEVEVLFFSTSVTLHVEREFNAGNADPRIAEMTGASDWNTYCGAFA